MSGHDWEPQVGSVVLDAHPSGSGERGRVTAVRAEHGSFPGVGGYWVDVIWGDGSIDTDLAAHWLTREDGTQ